MKKIIFTIFSILAMNFSILSQENILFSVAVGYGTSSIIFPFANVKAYDLREKEILLGSSVFPQLSVKYQFIDDISTILSVEYLEKNTEYYGETVDSDEGTVYIPVKDGYFFVPIELTTEYRLPFSTNDFKFFIGGGAGVYYFKSKRETAGVKLTSATNNLSYGIHIVVGFDYKINANIALFFSMKFRDPEIEFRGEYESLNGTYLGKPVTLGKKDFYQKLSLEGTVFLLGTKFGF